MFENNLSDPSGWHLGKLNNVREVFGSSALSWFLPIKTSIGDGLAFPSRGHDGDVPDYSCLGIEFFNTNVVFKENTLDVHQHSRPNSRVILAHETPNRTLINPVVSKGGQISVTDASNSMVRLDTNGTTQTVMLGQTDQTELTIER